MIDGTLETIDGRPALRFERVLPYPVERVWRAVSVPAELERWFPAAAGWTPAAGEVIEAAGGTGEVTEVDPPHRLAWTFAGQSYSFELTPTVTAAAWCSSTSSTTAACPRRPPPAGRRTCRGWSLIWPASPCPRWRRTGSGRRSTSATPSASGSIPRRAALRGGATRGGRRRLSSRGRPARGLSGVRPRLEGPSPVRLRDLRPFDTAAAPVASNA
ncbi:SRPBCC domain-containing protein [Nonomuraea thailandensis]